MAEVHGSGTYVSLATFDLSAFTDTCTGKYEGDEHESTAYGSTGHEVAVGLKKNGYTIGGKYVNGASGPRTKIQALLGTKVAFEYRAEGTGTTKPTETSTVHVKTYNQSSPVADIVRWTAELTVSGVVTFGTQP
jgi:hypothetical protein